MRLQPLFKTTRLQFRNPETTLPLATTTTLAHDETDFFLPNETAMRSEFQQVTSA